VTLMIQIFRFLEDGRWHLLTEIGRKARVPIDDLRDCCTVLSEHGILEYDEGSARIRLGRELMSMVTMLSASKQATRKWCRMGAGTVLVPPQKCLQIQGVSMQNMTEQDLIIEFTFKVKPIEIVISTV
jgi:hypothetical protein